jgi:hypothetical protein
VETAQKQESINYSELYCKYVMDHSDGHVSYSNKLLKWGDAFAAVCFAYGITWEQILTTFPILKKNHRHEGIIGKDYSAQSQIDFIKKYHTRVPKSILEIGGGRLEVVAFLSELARQLKVPQQIVVIEPGKDAPQFLKDTPKHYFPESYKYLTNIVLYNAPIHELNIDFSMYDTILMVESLEHILEEEWDPKFEQLKTQFKGEFIIVNWISYHPIAVGQYAPPQIHCRLVDDNLYDYYVQQGKTNHRNGSHLWLTLS